MHVGKAMLTGTMPAHSHSPSTTRIEAARSTHGLVAQAACLRLPAATRPARVPTDVATQLPALDVAACGRARASRSPRP